MAVRRGKGLEMANRLLEENKKRGPFYNAEQERRENIIGQRIQEVRKAHGVSLEGLSYALRHYGIDMKQTGIGRWESGTVIPNAYQLMALSHIFQIEDPKTFFAETPADADALNEEGLRKVREYKEDLIASGKYRPAPAPAAGSNVLKFREMPMSLLPVSAGPGAFLDENNFELRRFPADEIPDGAEFAIRISGDSMEPVYSSGQIIWVQLCKQLRPGDVGIFEYDGNGYVKMYDEQYPEETFLDEYTTSDGQVLPQPVLVSYNGAYAPRPVNPNTSFCIIGRVLKMRT
ncbi:MAG: LexA family transcriptional regulator [Oscillospiraceae bacterium]|nr:LexA family transcriptional regulator [Oscillospiraceae bacterium]